MCRTSLLIILILCYCAMPASTMQGIMASQKNLTKITWSHATNSQDLLNQVLASPINFIEADIVNGYLKNDIVRLERQPIMAHPPDEESDITLKSFLSQIWNFNAKVTKDRWKGVKLDFKSTDVFQKSLPILKEMLNSSYDVWLNADIFSGPVNNTSTQPVDPSFFLNESKTFDSATLSIGWTTKWGANYTEGLYTSDQVDNMKKGILNNHVKNDITFPVRAGIAAHSLDTLATLYHDLNNTHIITFTIWSSDSDNVDVEKLRKMIFYFGLDKVYIDVPENLLKQLKLDSEPKNPASCLKINILLVFLVLALSYVFIGNF